MRASFKRDPICSATPSGTSGVPTTPPKVTSDTSLNFDPTTTSTAVKPVLSIRNLQDMVVPRISDTENSLIGEESCSEKHPENEDENLSQCDTLPLEVTNVTCKSDTLPVPMPGSDSKSDTAGHFTTARDLPNEITDGPLDDGETTLTNERFVTAEETRISASVKSEIFQSKDVPNAPQSTAAAVETPSDESDKDGWMDGITYSCRICQALFKSQKQFEKHISDAHAADYESYTSQWGQPADQISLFKCRLCGQVMRKDRGDITDHLQAEHKTSPQCYRAMELGL